MDLSRNYGWEPIGVELNKEAAHYARDHYKLPVHIDYLENLDFPDSSFDLITMWGVIEHLSDPNRMLRESKRLLRQNGLLLLFVPNGHSLIIRIMRHYNSTVSGRAHLWYFTPATIGRLLNKNGYSKLHEFSVLPQIHEIIHFLQHNVPYVESECTCEEEFQLTELEQQSLSETVNKRKLGYKLITIAEKR
ncbi:MAG: class I SAM-dependent methyltransferase [Candidatus Omnitrophota bacterium]|nr:class I SAM-dependent methyltransferase [Candidatus Omnitrophota bacterium]